MSTVTKVTENVWTVKSQSQSGKFYTVSKDAETGKVVCNCPDFEYRRSKEPDGACKHILISGALDRSEEKRLTPAEAIAKLFENEGLRNAIALAIANGTLRI